MSNHRQFLIASLCAAQCLGNAMAQDNGQHHHHAFAADVAALHAVLAPLWHAPAGKARTRNVCAKAAKLDQLGKDIRSGDPAPLLASIATLKAQCKARPGDVAAAFSQVHDAFHQLIEPPRN